MPDNETDLITPEQGAQMVVDLQRLADIDEPAASALRSWLRFTPEERRITAQVHARLCKRPAQDGSV